MTLESLTKQILCVGAFRWHVHLQKKTTLPLPPQQEMHSTAIGSLFQGGCPVAATLSQVESISLNQCWTTDYTN